MELENDKDIEDIRNDRGQSGIESDGTVTVVRSREYFFLVYEYMTNELKFLYIVHKNYYFIFYINFLSIISSAFNFFYFQVPTLLLPLYFMLLRIQLFIIKKIGSFRFSK